MLESFVMHFSRPGVKPKIDCRTFQRNLLFCFSVAFSCFKSCTLLLTRSLAESPWCCLLYVTPILLEGSDNLLVSPEQDITWACADNFLAPCSGHKVSESPTADPER